MNLKSIIIHRIKELWGYRLFRYAIIVQLDYGIDLEVFGKSEPLDYETVSEVFEILENKAKWDLSYNEFKALLLCNKVPKF